VIATGLLRRREVPVPRLVDRAGQRHVEPDLDDLVLRAEHRLAHAGHPRMGDQVEESAQSLGVDLHVVPVRAAADRATRGGQRLLEQFLDVLAEPVGPLRAERGPLGDDALVVQFLGQFLGQRIKVLRCHETPFRIDVQRNPSRSGSLVREHRLDQPADLR